MAPATQSACSVRELRARMKIVQIFVLVIYLNYVSSYVLNRYAKSPKLISGSLSSQGSDHEYPTKVHRKRYTSFSQKSSMREVMNSYFKIGSLPQSGVIVSSPDRLPERSPDEFLDNKTPKLSSIQPTTATKKVKNVQVEFGDRSHQMPFVLQTSRPIFVMEKIEPNRREMESRFVKRPIIVVGRVRMAGGGGPSRGMGGGGGPSRRMGGGGGPSRRMHQGWRKKRTMELHFEHHPK